jgi:hypothetical protein
VRRTWNSWRFRAVGRLSNRQGKKLLWIIRVSVFLTAPALLAANLAFEKAMHVENSINLGSTIIFTKSLGGDGLLVQTSFEGWRILTNDFVIQPFTSKLQTPLAIQPDGRIAARRHSPSEI